jgi:hypothetical protein
MVQGILIMPLTMHKPLRFSVVNPSISPIIPPSRFHSLLEWRAKMAEWWMECWGAANYC